MRINRTYVQAYMDRQVIILEHEFNRFNDWFTSALHQSFPVPKVLLRLNMCDNIRRLVGPVR